jgi:hypothetical protein
MPVPSPLSRPPDRNPRERPSTRIWLWSAGGLLAGLLVFAAFGGWRASTPGIGDPLPRHLRYGFVLDGQSPDGFRVREGHELLRKGVIDTLIVSGVAIGGGVHYSTIWVRMLPLAATEKTRVVEMRSACTSTLDEARMLEAFFQERQVDSAVIVTSGFHVWRAASIFAKVSQGRRKWFFQAAPDSRWDGGWTDREGLKARFFEGTKRITWVLFEQWKPVSRTAPVPAHAMARGDDLGRLPAPAWKTAPHERP